MAAFKQDFTITQSGDCKTLTFTDISNFNDNTEGYTYDYFDSKLITVYDYDREVLGTPVVIVDDTPVQFTLDKDRYLEIVYTLQHATDTPLTKCYKIALSCNIDLAYATVVANELTCGCEDNVKICDVIKLTSVSQIYASRNNGVLSQRALDVATEYVSQLDTDNNCNCN